MRHYLSQDGDCHWYVVPVDKQAEWDDWRNLDPECEEAWDVPDFAIPVGGAPSLVTFADFVIA